MSPRSGNTDSAAPRHSPRSAQRGPTSPAWAICGIVLLALTGVLGLVIHHDTARLSSEYRFDLRLAAHHNGLLDRVATTVNTLFGPAGACAIIVILAVCVGLFRHSVLVGLRFAVLAGSGWVISEGFKILLPEQRPDQHLLGAGRILVSETGKDSFPSGHTACAVALVLAFCFIIRAVWLRVLVFIVGLAGAVGVALSRLYLGVHYPTDVIGAALAAAGMVLLIAWLWHLIVVRLIGARNS